MQSHQQRAAASRRNQTLRPIQTELPPKSPHHRPAPPRPEDASFSPSGERVPLRAPKPELSKSSLRNLFLRNKSSRNFTPRNDAPLSAISESQPPSASNSSKSATPSPSPGNLAPAPSATPVALAPPSLNKSPSNRSLQSSSNQPKEKGPRQITAWEPPPLFKAYPQALKHATLPTPNLSAETILKIDSHGQRRIARNRKTTVSVDADGDQNGELNKKKGEKIRKHSRTLSDHIRKADWSRKIYMVVTSGYLLQYSPDGPFDRQPEKIMELGKNSVAFASDVIPGKHWVLQISQTVEGKNTVTFDTRRTLFSRLGLADSRKSTKSMLLVFETPEELASWLTVIRREIESLGGKEFVPESPAEETPDLHRFSSFRVNRDSAVFEQPRPQIRQPPPPAPNNQKASRHSVISASNRPEQHTSAAGPAPDRTNAKQVNRRSVIQRPSTEAPSISTLNTPTELDRLRDVSRLSYVSTGTKTVPSSRGSSPGISSSTPRSANFPKAVRESPVNDRRAVAPLRERSSTSPSNTYSIDEEIDQHTTDTISQPLAGAAITNNFSRPTPNFSVPGFSRRYSTAIRSPPSSAHGNRPALQSSQALTSPPESPISTQYISSGSRTASAPLQHIRQPRSSTSIRKRTSTVNEESRTSSAMTSHSELSDSTDIHSAASRVARLRARRYSAYETGLKPGALAGGPVPELPKKRNDIDPLSQAIREINLKEDPAESSDHENSIEPHSRPVSIQFSSTPTHQLDHGITFEILSPRSRMQAFNTSSNPPRQRCYTARSNDSQEAESKRNSIATLASHKSMPVLPRGPPPAPPPDCPLPQVPDALPDFAVPDAFATSHINLAEPPPSPPPTCPLPQIPSITSHINRDDPPPAPPPECPLPQVPPRANTTHTSVSHHAESPPQPPRRAGQRSWRRVSRWMDDENVPGMPDLSYGLDPNDERAKRDSMINAF